MAASLERLTRRGGGGAIVYRPPATDPTEYRDRPIQVFSEHYMSVTRGSRATWVFQPDSATAPKNALGWMPVQLVPENAAPGRGGFPLRVGVNQNQALWFDIYVPRSIAAGSYHGAVLVSARGGAQRLPIELEVLDVQLPDDNTLPAMVYYQVDQPVLYHGRNLDSAYHRFAKRHRVEFVHAYDPERARAALGRLTGSTSRAITATKAPAKASRIVSFHARFTDPGRISPARCSVEDCRRVVGVPPAGASPRADVPLHARRAASAALSEIIALGERLKSNPGPGRKLPTLVTRSYTPELAPVIDIWAAGPQHYDLERAKSERAAGKEFWFYNGGRPAGGAIVIDSPATDSRVVGWAAFKHQADGYFYWHGVHWRHNNQKKSAIAIRTSGGIPSPSTIAPKGKTTTASSTGMACSCIRARRSSTRNRIAASRGQSPRFRWRTCAGASRTTRC